MSAFQIRGAASTGATHGKANRLWRHRAGAAMSPRALLIPQGRCASCFSLMNQPIDLRDRSRAGDRGERVIEEVDVSSTSRP